MVKCCCRELTAAHFSALVEYYMPQQKAKNSLKIPKGQPESVHRGTDSTMFKRKRIKGQRAIYKTLHRKIMIEQHEHH